MDYVGPRHAPSIIFPRDLPTPYITTSQQSIKLSHILSSNLIAAFRQPLITTHSPALSRTMDKPSLAPELLLEIGKVSHPTTARAIRSTSKCFHALLTQKELIWAEAGWRTYAKGLVDCWHWALNDWHTAILRTYMDDVDQECLDVGLSCATMHNDLDIITLLLEAGASALANNGNPLKIASGEGYLEVLKLLLTSKPHFPVPILSQPLLCAIDKGHLNIINHLIATGADVNDDEGEPLQLACRKGDVVVVKTLLEAGADVNAFLGYALATAARQGHNDMVRILLDAGADVHANFDASLVGAAVEGHAAVVQILLDAGATNYIPGTPVEQSALVRAVEYDRVDVVALLLSRISSSDPATPALLNEALSEACFANSADMMRMLLEKGADPRVEDDKALVYAAGIGEIDLVSMLLKLGANVHARNNNALLFAARRGHAKVVERLLEAGGDVDVLKRNKTLWFEVDLEMVEVLVRNGVIPPKFGSLRHDPTWWFNEQQAGNGSEVLGDWNDDEHMDEYGSPEIGSYRDWVDGRRAALVSETLRNEKSMTPNKVWGDSDDEKDVNGGEVPSDEGYGSVPNVDAYASGEMQHGRGKRPRIESEDEWESDDEAEEVVYSDDHSGAVVYSDGRSGEVVHRDDQSWADDENETVNSNIDIENIEPESEGEMDGMLVDEYGQVLQVQEGTGQVNWIDEETGEVVFVDDEMVFEYEGGQEGEVVASDDEQDVGAGFEGEGADIDEGLGIESLTL